MRRPYRRSQAVQLTYEERGLLMGKRMRRNRGAANRIRYLTVTHLKKCPLDKHPKLPVDRCICRES